MTYLAHFFAAMFLVNSVPHFVHGVSGESFQSPFAKPPGVGESSAVTNVIWGSLNIVIGVGLLLGVAPLHLGLNLDTAVTAAGALVTALGLAWHFGKVRQGAS